MVKKTSETRTAKETNEHSQFAKDRSERVQSSLLLSFSCVCYGHLTPSSLLHKYPERKHHGCTELQKKDLIKYKMQLSSGAHVAERCRCRCRCHKAKKINKQKTERGMNRCETLSERRATNDITYFAVATARVLPSRVCNLILWQKLYFHEHLSIFFGKW